MNCTIAAVQPSVIGRIRGRGLTDDDLRLCLSVGVEGLLLTDLCPHDEAVVDDVQRKDSIQQFQYLPSNGQSFRTLMD